jgi:myo-inositol 2-dehydrogenase/D-chiro-inositol 1-dehydrogenase
MLQSASASFGAGRIGTFHASTIARRIPRCHVAMVANPTLGKARPLAERYSGPGDRRYSGPVRRSRGRRRRHRSAGGDPCRSRGGAAEAGKPVWCEKPMAVTLADADRAIRAAAAAGVTVQVGFNRRFDAGFRAAHDAVVTGQVGTVQPEPGRFGAGRTGEGARRPRPATAGSGL